MRVSENGNGLVLALVGESGAGKTTTCGIIAEKGFAPIALAKHLRETAIAKYGTPKREEVQELARQTQETEGDDYYARVALSDPAFEARDVVIDGLRNLAELEYTVEAVKRSGRGFFLMAVLAPDDTRFSRVVNRARAGDPVDRARFDQDDARARGRAEDGFQQNGLLINLATHKLFNTGDLDALHTSIDEAIALARQTAAMETGS